MSNHVFIKQVRDAADDTDLPITNEMRFAGDIMLRIECADKDISNLILQRLSGPAVPKDRISQSEPSPIINQHKYIFDEVIEDFRKRDKFGLSKYGTRLQP